MMYVPLLLGDGAQKDTDVKRVAGWGGRTEKAKGERRDRSKRRKIEMGQKGSG